MAGQGASGQGHASRPAGLLEASRQWLASSVAAGGARTQCMQRDRARDRVPDTRRWPVTCGRPAGGPPLANFRWNGGHPDIALVVC